MKDTVTCNDFIDAFRRQGRENQFTYRAKVALFEYFEEYEDSTGEEMELDIIGICCDYAEYTAAELQEEYDAEEYLPDEDADPDDVNEWADALEDHTTVIRVSHDTIIIGSF